MTKKTKNSIKNYDIIRYMITKSKDLFRTLFFKISLIVLIILASTWGITFALENNIEDATSNFSVLGTVSEISESKITLTDARGSDDSGNTEYKINIDYLERVETRDYEPLIITDIKVGDTISGQGLTNGSVFFIKRIISFSSLIIAEELPIEELATTTATTTDELTEEDATTTEETIGETPANDSTSSTEEVSTSTASSSSDSIIDTVNGVISDVVDTVVDTVTDVVGGVIDLITGTTTDPVEEDQPTEPVVETPQNQSSEDSGTGQASNESSDENNVEQAESDIVSEEDTEISNEPEPVIVE